MFTLLFSTQVPYNDVPVRVASVSARVIVAIGCGILPLTAGIHSPGTVKVAFLMQITGLLVYTLSPDFYRQRDILNIYRYSSISAIFPNFMATFYKNTNNSMLEYIEAQSQISAVQFFTN